jgi:hypothetical protein
MRSGKKDRDNRLTLNLGDGLAHYIETKAGDIPRAIYVMAILQDVMSRDTAWHQQQQLSFQRALMLQQQMAGGGNV